MGQFRARRTRTLSATSGMSPCSEGLQCNFRLRPPSVPRPRLRKLGGEARRYTRLPRWQGSITRRLACLDLSEHADRACAVRQKPTCALLAGLAVALWAVSALAGHAYGKGHGHSGKDMVPTTARTMPAVAACGDRVRGRFPQMPATRLLAVQAGSVSRATPPRRC
jgi:hypothetical protein